MPHWRQSGCTYFVTYRLADSISKQVLRQWDRQKVEWLAERGFILQGEPWQVGFEKLGEMEKRTFQRKFSGTIESFLDEGRGSCVLGKRRAAQLVESSWRHFDGVRYTLHDLIIMPNHVHVMVTPSVGFELENILQGRKRHTAQEINAELGRSGQLWQKHSFDHVVRNRIQFEKFSRYIAENPLKAKLSKGDFLHYSESNDRVMS